MTDAAILSEFHITLNQLRCIPTDGSCGALLPNERTYLTMFRSVARK